VSSKVVASSRGSHFFITLHSIRGKIIQRLKIVSPEFPGHRSNVSHVQESTSGVVKSLRLIAGQNMGEFGPRWRHDSNASVFRISVRLFRLSVRHDQMGRNDKRERRALAEK
jgi:hypothetical protein